VHSCRQLFADALNSLPASDRKPLSFARPGKERQDSVYNGFQVSHQYLVQCCNTHYICIAIYA
jgi:2-C-methyl-D-erythritol 4-phosphate cytidylyltransferase